MLREMQLDGSIYDKAAIAIERIKTMAPIAENIYGGFTVMVSGGKDSTVIADLAVRSGTRCKFVTSWTGIEYPETVYFLRSEKKRFENLGYSFEFHIPRSADGKQITMWSLIAKSGFPTRKMRFCCQQLKENSTGNCYCILGVRWAESTRRKSTRFLHEERRLKMSERQIITNNDNEAFRRITENCMKKRQFMLNPIIEWSDEEVWEYIHERKLPYNPLYDQGHKRVGCIGCPMRANRTELEDNPKWAALYKKAGGKFLKEKVIRDGKYSDEDTYYRWWVNFCSCKKRSRLT
jgi:phosphoadenosine phosphosulfate reductase